MSKKVHLIDTFDGGMNESNAPSKIEKGQLVDANDVQFRKHGRIESMGEAVVKDDIPGHITHNVTGGYGIYKYNIPYGFSPEDAGATVTVHNQGTDVGMPIAFGQILYVQLSATSINDPSLWMDVWTENVPYTFTFALSGGQSLGAVTISQSLTSGSANYDNLGIIGGEPNYLQFYTDVAAACNAVVGNPITASVETWSNGALGVAYYAPAGGTTYNGQFINCTWSSNLGGSAVPPCQIVMGWNVTNPYTSLTGNPISSYLVGPTGAAGYSSDVNDPGYYNYHIMSGGAVGSSHIEKITVDSMSSSNKTWLVGITTDIGSTNGVKFVNYVASGGASTTTVATGIRDAINASSTITNADNIEDADGSGNADFATSSSNVVTLTSDETGSDSVFSTTVTVYPTLTNYTDEECIFIVTKNGYFYIQKSRSGLLSANTFLQTTGTDAQRWTTANPEASFYDADGTLRIFDRNLAHDNKNYILKFINMTNLWTGYGSSSDIDLQQWVLTDQDIEWKFTYESDSKGILTSGNTALGTGDQDKTMQLLFAASGTGTWGPTGAKKYSFHATAVYDEESETTPDHTFTFGADSFLTLNAQQLVVSCQCDPGAIDAEGNYVADFRVKGFNIYWSSEDDGYGVKNLLCEIDFKDGLIRADGGATTAWADAGQGSYPNKVKIGGSSGSVTFNDPEEASTWESRNLYNWQGNTQTARYKTATIAGRRTFIGNVMIGAAGSSIRYPDRIIYSPVNQFDIFPHPENILQTSTTDGEEIMLLENTGDRLFEFKKTILYVHNISSGDPSTFFLEGTYRGLGCFNPAKLIKTNDGKLFWINEFGAYLFDGDLENIQNLRYYKEDNKQMERITLETWQAFVSDDSIVGYDGISNTVIIKQTCQAVNTAGYVYQYDVAKDAWARSSYYKYPNYKKSTNFVTMNNGELVNLISTAVSGVDHTTNTIGLRLPATDGTAS